MLKVLLVEDETLFAKSVLRRLEREGHSAVICGNLMEARTQLSQNIQDVIMLDVRLPDGSGLDFLTELRSGDSEGSDLPVVIMTAYGELEDAVQAMKIGATDYLKKPVDLDELVLTLSKVQQTRQLHQKLDYSRVREKQGAVQVDMLGQSAALSQIRQQISRIADLIDKSSEEHPVMLITGETGTGKDVAARFYHQSGSWSLRPFVHVDCAALPGDLIEAELFGYEKGAFTNAHQAKAGLIEVAEDGTLFLDEVGELPLELQVKLLNVLERRQVRRIGSTKEYPVHAHFIAATNRDLAAMVQRGRFRSDLYFRMNVLELNLPALRERREDIDMLVMHYLVKIARRYGLKTPHVNAEALSMLRQYSWPGNIRELQHVLERAVMLCHDGFIHANTLMLRDSSLEPSSASQATQGISIFEGMTLEQVEKQLIQAALDRTAGNISRAARELGLTRMAMRYRMEKYQL